MGIKLWSLCLNSISHTLCVGIFANTSEMSPSMKNDVCGNTWDTHKKSVFYKSGLSEWRRIV